MLIKESKLRQMIRSIALKEMAMGDFTGQVVNSKENQSLYAPFESNLNYLPTKNPESYFRAKSSDPKYKTRFEQQIAYRLAAYPGCKVNMVVGISNLSTGEIIKKSIQKSGAFSKLGTTISKNILDFFFSRTIDITDNFDECIQELAQHFDMNDPKVKSFFDDIYQKMSLVNNNSSLIIYLGGHGPRSNDVPTAFNMLHQIFDEPNEKSLTPQLQEFQYVKKEFTELFNVLFQKKVFPDFHDKDFNFFLMPRGRGREEIIALLAKKKYYEKIYGAPPANAANFVPAPVNVKQCFEGTGVKRSQAFSELAINLLLMALGWLNPDDGTIMKDNATNQGLTGSSDPHDIIKRCLDPAYKNDEELISKLVSYRFHEYLIRGVAVMWKYFKGRIILTWSFNLINS